MRALIVLPLLLLSGCLPWSGGGEATKPDEIRLTPGAVILWQPGQTLQLQASIVDGDGQPHKVQPGFQWHSSHPSVVTVDQQGQVQAVANGSTTITVTANGLSRTAGVKVVEDAPLLEGHVYYEDRLQYRSGFTGEVVAKPVRHVMLDLLDAQGRVQQSTWTNGQGRYQFALVTPGPFSVRAVAISQAGVSGEISIADLNGRVYAVRKTLNSEYTVAQDVVITHGSQLAGVFNMLDVMVAGGQFVREHSRRALPPLRVFWQQGNSNGTYFCSGLNAAYCAQGAGIYIFSQGPGGDTDEFDDDVLWHEYSHYLSHNLSRDDSPGGCHVLSANDLDLRLAWSEGWGDFMPAAIKHWLLQQPDLAHVVSVSAGTSPSLYLDTAGNYAQISIDIAAPGRRPFVYAANELAVSKVLWGLMQQFGMSFIWRAFEHGLPAAGRQVNLEVFWDSLYTQHGVSDYDRALLNGILADREIYYHHDDYEPDTGEAVELADNIGQSRHLYLDYQTADEDSAFFNAQAGERWELETFWLSSGADTVIEVYSPDGRLLGQNNDAKPDAFYAYDYVCRVRRARNNDAALASKLVIDAPVSGRYVVKVRSHARRSAAGRYGSYTLRARKL